LTDLNRSYRPKMSQAGRAPTHAVTAVDERGRVRDVSVAGELPLTLVVDDREIVTLMTLGTHPEALALGFLRNQRLIDELEEIVSVDVDWSEEWVRVATRGGKGLRDQEAKLGGRTVTTGCGQGTVFAHTLDELYATRLPKVKINRSTVPALLREIGRHNKVYRSAGAVHGCALCDGTEVQLFTEDVGRHNAADAISGMMWLDRIEGGDKLFFTTGRLSCHHLQIWSDSDGPRACPAPRYGDDRPGARHAILGLHRLGKCCRRLTGKTWSPASRVSLPLPPLLKSCPSSS